MIQLEIQHEDMPDLLASLLVVASRDCVGFFKIHPAT